MNDLPENLQTYACDVRDLLGLQGWEIVLKMADELPEDERGASSRFATGAQCTYEEPYRVATITFVRGYSEDEYREFVFHEMLHLALAPLVYAGRSLLAMITSQTVSAAALEMFGDAEERVITPLAKALVKGIKPPKGDA